MLRIVGRLDGVVEQAFTKGGEKQTVAVRMLVVDGVATAEAENGVLVGPACARNDQTGLETVVGGDVGSSSSRYGGIEPDRSPTEAHFGRGHTGTSEQMLGGGVAEFARNPGERDDRARVATITDAEGVARCVLGGHSRA